MIKLTKTVLLVIGMLTVASVRAELRVVATTADLAALAEAIGGDRISVTTLAKAAEDPHFVDPKPSFIVKLNRADVLIEGGLGLESGWLPSLVQGARNKAILLGGEGRINAAEGIDRLEVPAVVDRAQGDVHPFGNPHYLVDPANAKIVAKQINQVFCKLDDHNCEFYTKNYEDFVDALDEKINEWQELLAPFKGTRLLAYHNTWPYFARRFDLQIDLYLEPKPGIPPTPSHLAKVISTLRQEDIPLILVEPYQHLRTAERVADRTDANVLELTQYPGGIEGTDQGYIGWLDVIINKLAEALDQ